MVALAVLTPCVQHLPGLWVFEIRDVGLEGTLRFQLVDFTVTVAVCPALP